MSYRNKAWYISILTGVVKNEVGRDIKVGDGMDSEAAYKFISFNLERPSFIYEASNAYEAYKEVYGKSFASPQEMKAMEEKKELELLRERVERLEIEKRNLSADKGAVPPPADPNKSTETDLLTKEQFKASHPELKGINVHHGWTKYKKEHGIVE